MNSAARPDDARAAVRAEYPTLRDLIPLQSLGLLDADPEPAAGIFLENDGAEVIVSAGGAE